jgi:hypothetical protein
VVAGSNPVSPTLFAQLRSHFYLLPKVMMPVHLIRCQRRPAIAISFPAAKPALACAFCANPDARLAAASSRRVVTRKSADGSRAFLRAPKLAVELGFSLRRQDDR